MAVVFTKKEKRSIIIRIVLIILLLGVIIASIIGIVHSVKVKRGFNRIESDYSTLQSLSEEFEFYYYLDDDNLGSVSKNRTEYTKLYSSSIEKIYMLLDSYNSYENINNVYYINHHINEDIQVEEILYDSLLEIYQLDKTTLLYGNLIEFWDNQFYSIDDQQKRLNDPLNNLVQAQKIEDFIQSYNTISLEFKENHTIHLHVPTELVSKINMNETEHYLDFSIYRNAIIMKYVKKSFIDKGYIDGYIVSNDGYVLFFGGRKNITNFSIFDNYNGYTSDIGSCDLSDCTALVTFYGFPFTSFYPYYELEREGETVRRGRMIDEDGYAKMDFDEVYVYGDMEMNRLIFIGSHIILGQNIDFDGCNYLYMKDKTITTNDSNIIVDSSYEVVYE